jgi:hypothetical protein
MSTSVLAKEFERLAERNAQLLHTDEGEGKSIAESAEKARQAEFDTNLTRLEELKSLLEKEQQFDELQKWASTPSARPRPSPGPDRAPAERPGAQGPSTPAASSVESDAFKAYLAHIAPDGKVSDNTDVHSAKFPIKALITGGSTSGGAFFRSTTRTTCTSRTSSRR